MQRKHRILTLTCCAFIAVISGCSKPASDHPPAAAATAPPLSIVPAPRELVRAAGQFDVTAATRVVFESGSAAEAAARYFVDLLRRTRGLALSTNASQTTHENGSIHFDLTASAGASNVESYSLHVSPERIVVSASDPRGLFYGAVTLWQLLTADPSANAADRKSVV